jgi:hypothetical protein
MVVITGPPSVTPRPKVVVLLQKPLNMGLSLVGSSLQLKRMMFAKLQFARESIYTVQGSSLLVGFPHTVLPYPWDSELVGSVDIDRWVH